MVFFAQLFTSKRGSLLRIWLAAHWEKKITKAHVYECNLETTIQDIISPQLKIGLRTSSYLLFGIVRIYSRKAKYLLADCNDAVVKIKMAFRPGQTDLPEEGMEAMVKAITLPEDFTDFESQLPDPITIDVADHFTLNQGRTEEITLKEDFGNVTMDDMKEDTWAHQGLFDMSFHSLGRSGDGFGDEGMAVDLVDFIVNANESTVLTEPYSSNKFPPTPPPTAVSAPDLEPAISVCSSTVNMEETSALNETTFLENDQGFALEPVVATTSSWRKRSKRKRKLLVDHFKELSDETIRAQLADCSDIMAPLELAPPTRQLMQWKETGGVDHLFKQFCVPLSHSSLQQLFPKDRFPGRRRRSGRAGVECDPEEMMEQCREGDCKSMAVSTVDELSLLQVTVDPDRATDAGSFTESFTTHVEPPQPSGTSCEESRMEVSFPDSLSDDSMRVHTSGVDKETPVMQEQAKMREMREISEGFYTPKAEKEDESILDSQDTEDKRMTRRAHTLLQSLRRLDSSPNARFSLHDLCRRNNRTDAAVVFFCLLVLKKQQALNLQQSAPYCDIIATPGPLFHQL